MKDFNVRVWQSLDLEEVSEHLLVVGYLKGDCARCKKVGIEYTQVGTCPECGTRFTYITCREDHDIGQVIRILKARPDLTFIHWSDFKNASGRLKARQFFQNK